MGREQGERVVQTETRTPEARAMERAKYLTGLLWHAGAFVIINGFFWFLDAFVGADGFQWAYWITLFWGFALAFHALAYFIQGRQMEERKAAEYLGKE
jgi:uncharacterized RDD family membrane protein YckC